MQTPVVRYGDESITYTVRERPAAAHRRIAIHVEPDGRVVVDAPRDASHGVVKAAVQQRARWISEQVGAVRHRRLPQAPREHVSGEALLYLGRRFVLKVLVEPEVSGRVRMRAGRIEVSVAQRDAAQVRTALAAWFRGRALDVFDARLDAVAASMPWVHLRPTLHLRTMTRRWGSCSPAGRLTLNPDLVKAPRECIDYVLIHELCHLKHHDHGPHFHRTLAAQMPGWREVKARLDGLADRIIGAP